MSNSRRISRVHLARLSLRLGLLCGVLMGPSCSGPEDSSGASTPLPAFAPRRIIAQGQILPADGIVQLSALPGDVITDILVAVGDSVQAGQTLLHLQSQQVADARLSTLHKRREDAARQREQLIAAAKRQLVGAELKIEQLKLKQEATRRTAELLELGKQQVEASRKILQKLQAISDNATTTEFVGELEIDRQRIQLAQAELDYRQQAETQKQSEEELTWGLQAAEQERLAASEQLLNADNAQTLEILDLEIAAAIQQGASTRVVAPTAGVVLAINVTKGESSIPGPLIEMADLSHLVCEIEINEMDAPSIVVGQTATITSRALQPTVLKGHISKKFGLVGRPQLRSLNPLARVDYRTVTAIVELDSRSTEIAKDWLQLQVEVEIDTSTTAASTTAPDNTVAPAHSGRDKP